MIFGESELKINFEISVIQKGYLKSGNLKFGENLNFAFKGEKFQIKNNEIKIKGISQNETELISIPIEFKREEILNSNSLNAANKIVFSGVYVDNEAIEHKIEKEVILNLSWKENTSTNIESTVIKNIDYDLGEQKGKILQTLVKVSGNNGNVNLPVKSTELVIDIPQIEKMNFQSAKVNVNKLSYTQGREDYEIEFSEDNYTINENQLIINVENNEKDGNIYNSYGEDVYVITYMYVGDETSNDKVNCKMQFTLNTYTNEKEEKTIDVSYDLTDVTNNVVEYTKDDRNNEVSKGYLVADSQNEKYEITYERKDLLNISRSDLLSSLEIVDKDEYFVTSDGDFCYTENENGVMSYYKTTKFSKENLLAVLGEEGKVEILNMKDEVISTISFDMEPNEDGTYIIQYEEPIGKIKIRTSKPLNDGNISIINTKSIKKLEYSRDIVKKFEKLVNISECLATYTEGAVDNLGDVESDVIIKQSSSNASLEIAQTELSTTVANESVNFKIRLNNNDDISDLYENPVFEIRLPKAIREIKIRNIDLFYANNELEIANVENFIDDEFNIIRVTLSGLQTSYNLNKETNGTIISFDVDLISNEFTEDIIENAEMCYYNADSVKYENEIEWNMYIPSDNISYLKNGLSSVPLTFKAPEKLINDQVTETKPEDEEKPVENEENIPEENKPEENDNKEDKVSSVKQDAQSELIEEGASSKLATMYISVMNNTSNKYSNFQILGRTPFAGNKEIETGKDLGTTVDTILDTEIKCNNSDILYTVYYSENGEATTDLLDESNGWKRNMYKMGNVKSYLILLNSDFILEPNNSLEFEYDYMIPANLSSDDAFYGTYTTYYKEEAEKTPNSSNNEVPERKPNETPITQEPEQIEKTTIEATIRLTDDIIKEISETKIEVILKNTGNVAAEDVMVHLPIMSEIVYIEANSDELLYKDVEDNTVRIYAKTIEPNAEKRIIIDCDTYKFKNNLKINSTVKAKNVDEISIETPEYPIEKKDFNIMENGIYNKKVADLENECMFIMSNISGRDLHNVVITKQLSKDITVGNVELEGVNSIDFDYDQSTGLLKFTIPEMLKSDAMRIKYNIKLDGTNLTGNEYVIDSETKVLYDDESFSFKNRVEFDLLDIRIRLLNSSEIGYISKNNEINYKYEVINNSKFDIFDIRLALQDSENINTEALEILKDDKSVVTKNSTDFTKSALMSLNAGQKMIVTTRSKIIDDSKNVVHATLKLSAGNKEFDNERNYSIIEDSEEKEYYELTGCAYIDTNKNKVQDSNEKSLPGIIVYLYNSETNEKVDSMITDVSGRYIFKGLKNGKYYVRFNYDESEYVLSSQNSDVMLKNNSNVMNINDNYMTDNISIDDLSVCGVDLQLSDEDIFDMKIDAGVERMTVQNNAESNTFEQFGTKLAKVDIDPKLVSNSKVLVEYKITVTNQGTIPGTINKIADYVADGMEFDSSLNPDWYLASDGNIYTQALSEEKINPNETRDLKLVLIKNMTEENTGLVHNTVEIVDAINDKGIADIDSTPGNQLDEDDLSYADSIIGVSTGLPIGVFPIVIVSLVVLIPTAVLVWRIIDKRRYV